MIVCGGEGPYFNEGGRYDPVLDKWTPMARSPWLTPNASAVWTGSEMLVWAPSNEFAPVRGLSYSPTLNQWLPLSTNIHTPVNSGITVWTGKEMIVWSGFDPGNGPRGGRY